MSESHYFWVSSYEEKQTKLNSICNPVGLSVGCEGELKTLDSRSPE